MKIYCKQSMNRSPYSLKNATLQVEKNNKAAGTRARKAALELSNLMKEFRKLSVDVDKK